jgi:hypothetical protein
LSIQIGSIFLAEGQIKEILMQAPTIHEDIEISGIIGPFDGKINSIFRVQTLNYGDLLIRCRTSKAFRYEPFIKEKILYPLLDSTLDPFSPTCQSQINEIVGNTRGSYQFVSPPNVPVQDLLFWDETFDILPFPYAIKQMIPGRSLYDVMQEVPEEQSDSPIFQSIFHQAGTMLGRLHTIQFPAFYETIDQIGNTNAFQWSNLYWRQCLKQLEEAKQHSDIRPLLPQIREFVS